jgi:hypothetical protein
MTCSRCHKEIPNAYAAITWRIDPDSKDANDIEVAKRQAGKYEVGRDYVFCFECLLDSFYR